MPTSRHSYLWVLGSAQWGVWFSFNFLVLPGKRNTPGTLYSLIARPACLWKTTRGLSEKSQAGVVPWVHLPSVGEISEGCQHKIAGQGQAEEDSAKLRKSYHHRKKTGRVWFLYAKYRRLLIHMGRCLEFGQFVLYVFYFFMTSIC